MLKVSTDDIRNLIQEASKKEREQIQAETEKKSAVRQMQTYRDSIQTMDIDSVDKQAFCDFIDEIIKADGEIPVDNPIKAFMLATEDEIQMHYESAQQVLNQTQSR